MLSTNSWETEDSVIGRKPWTLILLSLILVVILWIQMFRLQVLSWRDYLEESDDKRIKREVIEAPRGYIYDRNDVILAENRMSYSITIDPFERRRFDETVPRLASFLGENPQELFDRVKEITYRQSNPQKIKRDADFRLASVIEEHNLELPGVVCVFDQRRNYPQGPLASHVLGYMGESSEKRGTLQEKGYYFGQSIGISGIEKYYEDILKGKNGAKFEERNYMNRILDEPLLGISDEYKPNPPVPGKRVTLTIDVRLQMKAEEAFGDTIRGAMVALDPRNGEILLMVSKPSFDPNDFARVMTEDEYKKMENDPDKPLFNRALQATYPPGSPFKLITALAGLENGYSEETKFSPCKGGYYFGRWYKCWKESGHGSLDMVDAIINSCNVYFFQLARRVEIENWYPTGEMLGIGQKTGVDLYNEEKGILPSPEFYNNNGIEYSPGMMLNLAIGQGEIAVTMLQLARYTGIIAMEGLLAQPHFNIDKYKQPERLTEISQHSFTVVKRGMYGVVNNPSGTAKSARIPGHKIAGKTGTVQNPHGADHKIFIAFAPYDDPSIAVACVAENAGDYTGSLAVRIVKLVLTDYFKYYSDNTVVTDDKAH